MSDNNENKPNNQKPQDPQKEPLIKGDVPDFEYTPEPPEPPNDEKDSD